MKLSLPPKLVEKLVWVPVISFCKIFIPSYAFDAILCWNWPFSPPNRLTLRITLLLIEKTAKLTSATVITNLIAHIMGLHIRFRGPKIWFQISNLPTYRGVSYESIMEAHEMQILPHSHPLFAPLVFANSLMVNCL